MVRHHASCDGGERIKDNAGDVAVRHHASCDGGEREGERTTVRGDSAWTAAACVVLRNERN